MICLAPLDISFSEIGQTSFKVNITSWEGQPAVERYEATAVGGSHSKSCTVLADASPLSCLMSGLTPSTEYTVSVVACLPGLAGCGQPIVRTVRTGMMV